MFRAYSAFFVIFSYMVTPIFEFVHPYNFLFSHFLSEVALTKVAKSSNENTDRSSKTSYRWDHFSIVSDFSLIQCAYFRYFLVFSSGSTDFLIFFFSLYPDFFETILVFLWRFIPTDDFFAPEIWHFFGSGMQCCLRENNKI